MTYKYLYSKIIQSKSSCFYNTYFLIVSNYDFLPHIFLIPHAKEPPSRPQFNAIFLYYSILTIKAEFYDALQENE